MVVALCGACDVGDAYFYYRERAAGDARVTMAMFVPRVTCHVSRATCHICESRDADVMRDADGVGR